jgi:protein MPE1
MAKPTAANAGKSNRVAELDKAMTEQERLDAMFKLTDAQWQEKQEEMSHAQRVQFQGGKPMKRANIPEGEPPHGYICYRCGKKGKFLHTHCINIHANIS